MSKELPKLVVLLGPTAAGKTEVALKLARKFNGEIVSADSRTIYKKMDIGTSKPTKQQQRHVKHHLIDIAKPSKIITLADWQQRAVRAINGILKRKKVPFLVGGTGLYISCIVDNYRIPQEKRKPRYTVLLLGKTYPRTKLYTRINARMNAMIRSGLETEIKALATKYSWALPSMHGIGYREWKAYFNGMITKPELITEIQKKTRNYAKRQMTWFRGIEKKYTINWISDQREAEELIEDFLK